ALRRAALHLPLDVRGVHGGAGVLDDHIAQDPGLAGLGVDLDVADLGAEGAADPHRRDRGATDHRRAGVVQLGGNLLEGEALVRIARADDAAVLIDDLFGGHAPDSGGALDQLAADVHPAFVGGDTAGEGARAAPGDVGVADRVGIDDDRLDV